MAKKKSKNGGQHRHAVTAHRTVATFGFCNPGRGTHNRSQSAGSCQSIVHERLPFAYPIATQALNASSCWRPVGAAPGLNYRTLVMPKRHLQQRFYSKDLRATLQFLMISIIYLFSLRVILDRIHSTCSGGNPISVRTTRAARARTSTSAFARPGRTLWVAMPLRRSESTGAGLIKCVLLPVQETFYYETK